jgi:GT2 family glycosyltransferase
MTYINKIYLIDDNSNNDTKVGLKKIKEKYGDIIDITYNKKNQGFVKNCNYAFKITSSDFVLLLNSDCLVSNRAIEKMINAMKKDKKIGLLCPISSKAANLSYPLVEGFDYQKINKLFEKSFEGKTFNACTVVGNCLMVSRKCIDKVGGFDEIYEHGYTEETDYQFKAMKKGFKAKVLIDTYVFHECRVSFGEDKKQLEIRNEHLDIFFSRWKKEYDSLYQKYIKNNPIDYINEHLFFDYEKGNLKFIIDKNTKEKDIDFINNLIIEGKNIDIITNKKCDIWKKYNTLFIPKIKKFF